MAQVNLGHVKGDKGDTGSQGPQGIQGIQGVQGPAGPGCPTGGTAGQVLMKDSGTDYDYEWSDINFATHREIPLAVGTNAWTLSSGIYTAEFTSAYITDSCKWELVWDESYRSYAKADILVDKKTGGGGLTLKTTTIPTGTITGTVTAIDPDDGKVPVIIEDTVVSIANGGTGQSSLAGAQSALGITELNGKITNFVTLSSTNYNVLADACQAFIDAMGSNKYAVGDLGYNSFRYVVDCYKYSDSWATMSLFGYSGASFHCWKENGTWKTEKLALNSDIATEKYTYSISESIASGVSKQYTKDVTKTGYTPIGIIQHYGSGTGSFAFQDVYISQNTAVVYVRNVSSSAATLTNIQIVVLYQKT